MDVFQVFASDMMMKRQVFSIAGSQTLPVCLKNLRIIKGTMKSCQTQKVITRENTQSFLKTDAAAFK